MANASFKTQADALLRKNLIYLKRNKCSYLGLIAFPVLLCIFLVELQLFINSALDEPRFKCGCNPLNKTDCGLRYSDSSQAIYCAVLSPPKWPGLLQVPAPEYRAVQTDFASFSDLPNESCRKTGSCPVSILVTGSDQSLAQSLGVNMLRTSPLNSSDPLADMSNSAFGSDSIPGSDAFLDSAFLSDEPLYHVQPNCTSSASVPLPVKLFNDTIELDLKCAQGQLLWRTSSSGINKELYEGYHKGNSEGKINEFLTAYDFLNSNTKAFNVSIWYNSSYSNNTGYYTSRRIAMTRVSRSVNLASNAYLQFLKGLDTRSHFAYVKEMPKQETHMNIDIASLLSAQFFTYVIIALFPVVLTFLVYENQNGLRMMMKMHGLGDGPYWLISYAYFLSLSVIYMFCFAIFGSLIGLKIFTVNDYGIQFVFYFIYMNLQISCAFLVAPFFSNVLTARVLGYILIFGSGLLGGYLLQPFVEDTSFPRKWVILMELYPGFSLYRGLYELGQFAFTATSVGTRGMRWKDLNDSSNGMTEVLIIMLVEWLLVLPTAYFVDHTKSSGVGVRKSIIACVSIHGKKTVPLRMPSLRKSGSKVYVQMEKPDVIQEREKVEQLLMDGTINEAIICDNLAKVYPGRDGNPPKAAVKGLSLALPRGECFGMLGPNGAGKTSFIGMMTGLLEPTSGRVFVDGKDLLTQMREIYTSVGVCPQHDLLWETLTGKEHLMFYGRLKNLKGDALKQDVEESLKSVNLFHGGVRDKFAGKYSGGMKRRLSVAISFIGDPKVVYLDEPSTGLDPASRKNLWDVVKQAKRDRAIILTTHSMEEAEALCDRLGIFVDGNLQCIGNPRELKGRYGGSFVFTMTTSPSHDTDVESMVRSLSPNAQKTYHISGTQKFELPRQEVSISDVFRAVQKAKSRFSVYAWGVADTTLEDVFIKVARDAQPFNTLS